MEEISLWGKLEEEKKPWDDWHECISDRYDLKKLLGSGSYGKVVLGVDRKTKEKVAIKRVDDLFYSRREAKKILREILILKNCQHKYIVKLIDVIAPPELDEFNEIYLVMELTESDLKKISKSTMTLSKI